MMMNDLPRAKLKYIIAQYGRSLAEDPKRCEAFLRDFCGQYRKEISVLVSAMKEGIPTELSNSQNKVPSDILLARLTKRLENHLGLSQEAAKWAVESWEFALGLNSQKTSTTSNNVKDENSEEEKNEIYKDKIYKELVQGRNQIKLEPDKANTELLEKRKILLDEANKKIEETVNGSLVYGLLSTVIILFSNQKQMFFLGLLACGFSFGIERKSKIFSLIMFVFSIPMNFFLKSLLSLYLPLTNWLWLYLIFMCSSGFFRGVEGTFDYHNIMNTGKK